MSEMTLADIYAAAARIRGLADQTPFIPSALFADQLPGGLWLKAEMMQPIGAFKLRGAVNAMAQLPEGAAGVTCCSTGNHGRAVAWAAKRRGVRAVVCMSSLVPEVKVRGIEALGAEIRITGRSQDDAQLEAERLVAEEGFVEINPYDHPHVIAGQGTIGLEMLAAKPDLQMILVPLSGGGLAAGVALAAKSINPAIRVIGITMDRGAAMYQSLRAGYPVQVTEMESLADSLGGGIGLTNDYSMPMCARLLDDSILVTEEEIRDAMQALYFEDRLIAEGGCVVGIAALMSGKLRAPNGPVATILTGRNIDMTTHARLMTGQDVALGEMVLEGRVYPGAPVLPDMAS